MDDKELQELYDKLGPSESADIDKLFPDPHDVAVTEQAQDKAQQSQITVQNIEIARAAQFKRQLEAQAKDGEYNTQLKINAAKRAARSNMKRRLSKRFDFYASFTVEEAALQCKCRDAEIRAYLESECLLPNSQILYLGSGKFCIKNPFE